MDAPVIQVVGGTIAVHVGTAILRTRSGDGGASIDAIVDAISVLVDALGGTAGRAPVTRFPGTGIEAIRDAVLVEIRATMKGEIGIESVDLVGVEQLLGPREVELDTGLKGASKCNRRLIEVSGEGMNDM